MRLIPLALPLLLLAGCETAEAPTPADTPGTDLPGDGTAGPEPDPVAAAAEQATDAATERADAAAASAAPAD